jgi:hypothetical protein
MALNAIEMRRSPNNSAPNSGSKGLSNALRNSDQRELADSLRKHPTAVVMPVRAVRPGMDGVGMDCVTP